MGRQIYSPSYERAGSSKFSLGDLSQAIEEQWNEWQIRILMLLSFFLQIFLAIFGKRGPKRATGSWFRASLWIAYLLADSVAAFSLGILSRSEPDSTNPNLIPVFWAPILLVHLGAPRAIIAYSMDEVNKLFLSCVVQLVTRVGVAGYVMFRLWRKNAIMWVSLLILISGIIKYSERIWILKRRHQHNELLQPSPKGSCIPKSSNNNCTHGVRYIHDAYRLFLTLEILLKNFDLDNRDQKFTYDMVSEKGAEDAFRLIEVELGFKYDRLYSNMTTISWRRITLRFITFLSSISALVCFSVMTKSKRVYSKKDWIISYVLLIGVVCLESYSIIMHLFSEWAIIWLSQSQKEVGILNPSNRLSLLLSFCMKSKRWSRSMGQLTLISPQSNLSVYRLLKNYFTGKWNIHSTEKVDKDLKELIFKQVLDKRSRYNPEISDFNVLKGLLEERGHMALGRKDCFDKFGWSVAGVEFLHSLLTWHIATQVCYDHDSKKFFGKMDPGKNSVMSRSLSNYMLYLLIEFPTMLAVEPSVTRCADTRIHLRRLLFSPKLRRLMDNTTSKELDASFGKLRFEEAEFNAFFDGFHQDPHTMLREIEKQEEGEMSALLDGCMLAFSLRSLETKDGWSNDKKWEMISHVWVEMLMYAASHCGWKEHTRALSRGGELLTHVCLLMAHLGLSKQCPPAECEQLAARNRRLADILKSESSSIEKEYYF